MTVSYVNSEVLWLQNTLQGYLQKMLAVEDDGMSQSWMMENSDSGFWWFSMADILNMAAGKPYIHKL